MRALFLLLLALQGAPRTGTVEGFVIRSRIEPVAPLINARLVLEGGGQEIVARSDSSGHFLFSGLLPGRYRLRVTKDGFVRQEYPRSPMGSPGVPIDLGAGQAVRNIVFRLDPAPTISGVIRDDRNAPLAGVVVQALKRGYNTRGGRNLSLIASARTDDHGAYRLYWLDPGEYVIAATPPPPPTLPRERPVVLSTTYFPGFPELDDARIVRVGSSRDAAGIDFRLVRQPLSLVYGNILSLTTFRPVEASVTLTPPDDVAGIARYQTRSSGSDGKYEVPGVAPGTYIASAFTSGEAYSTRIRVRAGDLRVNLELGPGVEISGRATATSDAARDLREIRVHLVETEFSVPAPQPAPLDRAGNFAFSSVQPGAYAVSLSDLPDDVYLKESTPDVFAVRRGSRGSISIEIGTDGARVTGIAVDQDGMPFAGAQVTLIPASDSRTRPDRYRTTVSGPDGTFTIRGIVPGDYRAFAWHGLEPNAYLNVEYMRDYLDVGTPLHLEPRQNGTVPLRVISLGQ